MLNARLAKREDINRLKEIWKLCFGDSDIFINFYYDARYKENQTLVLLKEDQIAAMLTLIPVNTISLNNQSVKTMMFYAIATHPKYQHKGFATYLIDYANKFLNTKDIELSILVPATKELFEFYRTQGYQEGFYIRELQFSQNMIDNLSFNHRQKGTVRPISPKEYNHRRNKLLAGRLYIKYLEEDIDYQKKLSQLSGADIYALDISDSQGCIAVERLSSNKILIKEMLVPEELISAGIKKISQVLEAEEYVIRTPAFYGEHLGGTVRAFGMIKGTQESGFEINPEKCGYLGFAFD